MKIIVEEEYGYRYWLWNIKASSAEGLEKYFNSVALAPGFYCSGTPDKHLTEGEWTEIDWEEYKTHMDKNDFDGHVHIHQDDDSHIKFRTDYQRTIKK